MHNSENGTNQVQKKLVTVYFDRYINDMPVIGHSRIVVTLGEHAELAGLIKMWTNIPGNLKFVANSFLSETEVRKQFKDMLNRHYKKWNNNYVEGIDVTKASYILYDDGRTIEPALFILGEVAQYDGTSYRGDWIIPVLKNAKANYKMLTEPPVMPSSVAKDESAYLSSDNEEEDDEEEEDK